MNAKLAILFCIIASLAFTTLANPLPAPGYNKSHKKDALEAMHRVGNKRIDLLTEGKALVNNGQAPSTAASAHDEMSNQKYRDSHYYLADKSVSNEINAHVGKARDHLAKLAKKNSPHPKQKEAQDHERDLSKVASWTGPLIHHSYLPHEFVEKVQYPNRLNPDQQRAAIAKLDAHLQEAQQILNRTPLPAKKTSIFGKAAQLLSKKGGEGSSRS